MRLRLTIRPLQTPCSITLNYNYYLSSAIYRWIEASSPEYSAFLHQRGFQPEGMARRFKHFCFSQLMVEKREVRAERLHIFSPIITWYVAMPVEESLQHFVIGLFEKQHFYIESPDVRFTVEQVSALPDPVWSSRMHFRMLSPTTVSVAEKRNGKLVPRYLYADPDPSGQLAEALRSNIINKYRSLYGNSSIQPDQQTEFRCMLDEKFIADRGGPERVSKLIAIKEGQPDQTRVRAFMCPLTIEGNPALIRLAYESGLGEKNSLGFGMLEQISPTDNLSNKERNQQTGERA